MKVLVDFPPFRQSYLQTIRDLAEKSKQKVREFLRGRNKANCDRSSETPLANVRWIDRRGNKIAKRLTDIEPGVY